MSEHAILVINCGSSSLKFAVIEPTQGLERLSGLAECLGSIDAKIKWQQPSQSKNQRNLPEHADHKAAMATIVDLLSELALTPSIVAVGHRVVHGGEQFSDATLINDDVITAVSQLASLAPLHNPVNLIGIHAAKSAFSALPQVAVFDTAFHQGMAEHAYLYALPYRWYQEHGIRRYGFHGTSHYFVGQQTVKQLALSQQHGVITVHLGNGCSVCAIENGRSIDTSMGMTPLEGLVMGTRSGDIDPGVIIHLQQHYHMTASEIDELLNKQSGLLGLSEISNDCRTLEQAYQQGDRQAALAINVFCYRIARYIASFAGILPRLDAITFTGGIGENSALIRNKVLNYLAGLHFRVDEQANLTARFGQAGVIAQNSHGCQVFVCPTNEEWVIAQHTAAVALITE